MPTSILENELCRFPPTGVTDPDGNRTVRKVMVPFSFGTLEEIKTYYLGVSFEYNDGSITRWLPYNDPDSFQYMIRLDHTGFLYRGREVTLSEIPFKTRFVPQSWVFTAHFSTLPYPLGGVTTNPDEDVTPFILGTTPPDETTRFARKKIVQGRKEVGLAQGTIWLDTPGKRTQLQAAPTVMIPYQDIDVTWFAVPVDSIPWDIWDDCIGRVNDAEMTLPGFPDGRTTYPAESILFEGVRPEEMRFADDTVGMNLVYGFQYVGGFGKNDSVINHNTLPDAGGVFRRAYRSEHSTNLDGPYFKTDLSQLFTPRGLLP